MTRELFTDEELAAFKAAQRLAFDATLAVEAELREGITEQQAAGKLEQWLRARGVSHFFHYGFVWFGDRTGFLDFPPLPRRARDLLDVRRARATGHFRPSGRRLKQGDAVILDIGPIHGGGAADIGYSCSLGEPTEELHETRLALAALRPMILALVRAGETQAAIDTAVDEYTRDHGYVSIHSKYPGSAIAHRVGRVPGLRWPTFNVKGFSPQTLGYLGGAVVGSALRGDVRSAPFWQPGSARPCEPGLWAFEPHLGHGAVGAKWGEVLVVTEDTAYWLDDDLPHVRYAAGHGVVQDAS
ncbi:M24 family metallopeptidase [Amycolatopsis rhabdoformis]|uniref:M24 family metallopeptidase n=1 Tax=Amycolatopsis rhabdoformis TaxID=1448059 RepID=A0ABZ1IHL4_9PSEU|nr:M24 family metallopeptidase [Amycolatopsis rhabdoformis]WSE33624.1 M24 family metallopeptidase [Amycolatopsis rhabdoformis]